MRAKSSADFIKDKNITWEKERQSGVPIKKKFYDLGREGYFHFVRHAWTFHQQHNLKQKIFVIEKLEIIDIEGKVTHKDIKKGDIEYRFGYYIINKKGNWHWGQYCPLIPGKDLKELLNKAEEEGTISY